KSQIGNAPIVQQKLSGQQQDDFLAARGGEGAGCFGDRIDGLPSGVDLLPQIEAIRLQIKRQARHVSATNLIERIMNRSLVRRRREKDAKTAVNRSDRPIVLAAAKTIVDELLEPLERAIAFERSHGVAVDENQNFAPESLVR